MSKGAVLFFLSLFSVVWHELISYYDGHMFSETVIDLQRASTVKVINTVSELRAQGKDVVMLSIGDVALDLPLFPIDGLPFPDLYHYSHSHGIVALRKKACDYYTQEYDVPCDPEREILITTGAKAAIHFALMSLLNPGDEVLISEPAWVSYPEQIKLCGANPVLLPYRESVFDYEKYITGRTKLIIINNPQNPTGKVFSRLELAYVLQLAYRHNLYVLSDECYSEFTNNKFISFGSLDKGKKRVIISNSFSKNFGLSGWRLGYIIAHERVIDQISKVNQHIITCPATILEFYLVEYYDDLLKIVQPQIRRILAKREEIAEYMDELGLIYMPGDATFYFFVSIAPSRLTSEEFSMKLLNQDLISTVPGIGFGSSCDSFIRISVGVENTQRIKDALCKLKALIKETS